ncbi:MAG: hypothetical protein LC107_13150 [Chitinophagales bacterium]|nr:hypothetical protein [Chitinophagales bacterium]
MKNLLSLIAVFVLVGAGQQLSAQKTLNKGTITMEITEVKADDPQMEMGLAALRGSQTQLFFNEKEYVTNMDMMGGMISVKTRIQQGENKMDMLMDAMGNKIWVESALDKAQSPAEKEMLDQSKIVYDKNDTKKILGYNCYKMTLTNPEMAGVTITGYVTQDIKTPANLIQGMQSIQFEGYLMEYTFGNPQFSMTTVAVKISEDVDAKAFEMDTKGYKKMTMEEFQKSMGSMGGMGF